LIFTGLVAAVAFKAKLWNIGEEGQLYAGAFATALGIILISRFSHFFIYSNAKPY